MSDLYLVALKERLLSKTYICEDGCWHCSSGGENSKYGTIYYQGSNIGNHQASWLVHKGPIPQGTLVLHYCDYKRCINPNHLFLGTEKDNIRDCMIKGRRDVRTGSRNPAARLSEAEVLEIKHHLCNSDLSQRQIGEIFGVGPTVISQIKTGKRWSHV